MDNQLALAQWYLEQYGESYKLMQLPRIKQLRFSHTQPKATYIAICVDDATQVESIEQLPLEFYYQIELSKIDKQIILDLSIKKNPVLRAAKGVKSLLGYYNIDETTAVSVVVYAQDKLQLAFTIMDYNVYGYSKNINALTGKANLD